MIEVNGLIKRYGEKTAVNGLTFTVQPGLVTGFLGATMMLRSSVRALVVLLPLLFLVRRVWAMYRR